MVYRAFDFSSSGEVGDINVQAATRCPAEGWRWRNASGGGAEANACLPKMNFDSTLGH